MARSTLTRALLALGILATASFLVLTRPAKLGLDLRGGTQIVLQAKDSPTVKVGKDVTDRTLEVLRRRVDQLGVSEPALIRSGNNRIIVELPGVSDPKEALAVIGRTAQLTFHPVLPAPAPQPPARPGATPAPAPGTVADEDGLPVRIGPTALTGNDVSNASATVDAQTGGGWQVSVEFRGGGNRWAALTGAAACNPPGDPKRRVAIVLDNKVISSPQVAPDVACRVGIAGGATTITGQFTESEAKDLALLIRAGALPVPVEVIEQRTVGPTLGADAIQASVAAAVLGAALTVLFIATVYRLAGVLAAVALLGYGLISYAALLALGATLTLPGIAGFVLAIGMAVDANVLVFERAREEYAGSHGNLRRAVSRGFRNALSAVVDSNVTTVLAAVLLFFLASGPVRGFGVTLTVGVLASMFTTMVLTRVLLEAAASRSWLRSRPRLSGLAGNGRVRRALLARRPDLMRYRRRFLVVSAGAVLIALAGIGVRGLNFGVEFTGGRLVEYSTSQQVDPDDARRAVSEAGLSQTIVQRSDAGISVRGSGISEDGKAAVQRALSGLGGGQAQLVREELIGPSLGDELRRKAVLALGIALMAQMIYLAVRFQWTFGVAAVLAMAHDVAILLGVFAWLGKPIDGVFLAALLTVIGYSVNDSVVVFDRVRELLRVRRREPFATVANDACLQTLPRTVNTGMGALFILTALALLGGDTLTDFAIALLIGVGIGTYSSVFTATPLAIALDRRAAPRSGTPRIGTADRPLRTPTRAPASRTPVGRAPRDSGARI